MGYQQNIIERGYTNHHTEDIGAVASGKRLEPKGYWCRSDKCCRYIVSTKEYVDKSDGQPKLFHSYGYRLRVFKCASIAAKHTCIDCGQALFKGAVPKEFKTA